MGGTTSVQLPYIKEFESKEGTKAIMNAMLEYMMTNLTIKDFASLSDPATCKSYVLFKANLISKYFYELRILPITDAKTGVIAFRKAKDLTDLPSGSKAEQEKQSLCLILSYYYTRIFQIYGALALTLIEDVKTSMQYLTEPTDRFVAPGYVASQLPIMRGGAFDQTSAGVFVVLSSFISSGTTPNQYGYVTEYTGLTTDSRATIRFIKKDKDAEGRTDVHGEFTIFPEGTSQIGTLFIKASPEPGSTEVKLKIEKLTYSQKGELKSDSFSSLLSEKTITIDTRANIPTIKGSTKKISDYFNELFEKLVPYLKKQIGAITGTDTPKERIDHLGYYRIITNLTRDRPLGHCMARAMQLLKSPIFESDKAESYVCMAKFISKTSEKGETSMWDAGLPEPGKSITESRGILALDDLFYDTIAIHSPKLGMSSNSVAQYKIFRDKMSAVFEGQSQDKPIGEIRSQKDRERCADNNPIRLTGDKYAAVKSIYNQLIHRQRIHAVNCGKILVKLFNINVLQSSIKVSLNDRIIQQGFSAISQINNEAREVLINYYADCESTYLKGRNIILGSQVNPPKQFWPEPLPLQQQQQQAAEAVAKAAAKAQVPIPTQVTRPVQTPIPTQAQRPVQVPIPTQVARPAQVTRPAQAPVPQSKFWEEKLRANSTRVAQPTQKPRAKTISQF